MTKKHFIELADRLRGLDVPEPVMDALLDFCRSVNPAFKRARFLDYLAGRSGPNGGLVKARKVERGQA